MYQSTQGENAILFHFASKSMTYVIDFGGTFTVPPACGLSAGQAGTESLIESDAP